MQWAYSLKNTEIVETCYTVKSKISNGQIFSPFLLFAGDSCDHWMHYSDATKTRSGWAKELLNEFKSNVELLKQAVKDQVIDSPPKSPPAVSPQNLQTGILFTSLILYFHEIWKLWKKRLSFSMLPSLFFLTGKEQIPKGTSRASSISSQQPKGKLMSSPIVVRLADFNIYQVHFFKLVKLGLLHSWLLCNCIF